MSNTDTGKQISETATQVANLSTQIEKLASTLTDAAPSGSGIAGAVDLPGILTAVKMEPLSPIVDVTVSGQTVKGKIPAFMVPKLVFLVGLNVVVTYVPRAEGFQFDTIYRITVVL